MNQTRTLTMTHKELNRLQIIYKVLERHLTQVQAAQLLDLSDRQVRRITKRVESLGEGGIIHRLRGRASHKKLKDSFKERIKKLYQSKYTGFGPTFASEKLDELDGINISRESLRKILTDYNLWQPKLKGRKHQLWRERKGHYGQMIQMDGSVHDWLEDRGPRLVLMGYIDDATNKVFGQFYTYEGTIPAMDSFKKYIQKYGIPQSVYLDKHSTYKSQARDTIKDVEGTGSLSQFERALKELNVTVIHANSPAAKGRVERLFRTLQDRLVKELRLQKVKTLEGANEYLKTYLPIFNKKFSIESEKQANLHRRKPKHAELTEILSIKTMHPLRNDFTVIHKKKLYQVLSWSHAKKVEVREYVDGRMSIMANGRKLKHKWIAKSPRLKPKRSYKAGDLKHVRMVPKGYNWAMGNKRTSPLLTIT